MFYFNWINGDEALDKCKHLENAIEIFDLIISEAETVYPTAIITVEANQEMWHKLRTKMWAIIYYNDGNHMTPLFRGCIHNYPIQFEGATAKIELIAKPLKVEEKITMIRECLIQSNNYDMMLFPGFTDIEQVDLADLLIQHCNLIYWDRITHQVCLTPYISKVLPIKFIDKHFKNSLNFKVVRKPISCVDVKIVINWTQEYHGETCLDPVLQHYFKDGTINTITGDDFKERWWKNGERIGNTGYTIKRTNLFEVKPELLQQPLRTKPILLSNKDPILIRHNVVKTKRVRLKRHYFRPTFTVQWHYYQQRHEQLNFQVYQNLKRLNPQPPSTKQLIINLTQPQYLKNIIDWAPNILFKRGDYCRYKHQIYICLYEHHTSDVFDQDKVKWIFDSNQRAQDINTQIGVFFSSERGQHIIKQVTQQAKVILEASRRCVDIKFCCRFQDALELTTQHTIELHDNRLPNGFAIGKIKKIILHACGKTGQYLAYITISCSLGTLPSADESRNDRDNLFEQNIFDTYDLNFKYKHTNQGILFPQFLGAQDILKNVHLMNEADAQETVLLSHQYPFGHNIEYILNRNLTRLKLILEDLKSLPRITQRSSIPPIYIAAEPAQIII